MRGKVIVSVVTAVALAVPAATGLSEPTAQRAVTPLLGLIAGPRNSSMEILTRVDARTLRPLRRPRTAVATDPAWDYSPDRRSLALGVALGLEDDNSAAVTLRVVNATTLRTQARIRVGNGVPSVHWVAPNRVLVVLQGCCDAPTVEVVAVDPFAGRVLARRTFDGELMGGERTSDGIALVVSPPHAIGHPRFVVVDADGRSREIVLDRIQAGFDEIGPDADGNWVTTKLDAPGFAVDPSGARAYVVSGDGPISIVELADLGVTYVTPAATRAPAKGEMNGPERYARFVGGALFVTGSDFEFSTDASGHPQSRATPAGLWRIDASSWREAPLQPSVDYFVVAGDEVLATGRGADNKALGLTAYGFDGALRFHKAPAVAANVWFAYGDRVFANGSRSSSRLNVLDLRTGRVVGHRPSPPPWLLLAD